MGVVSRKIFPACGSVCICCPALRSRSRQPVKRYKKLLAEIFPKSLVRVREVNALNEKEGPPSERKIVKLCEYAAKNPFRIPKIVKYLEERCYKELRHDHIKFVSIVTEAYNKLLCICKEQMAYFAVSLLNVVAKLLDNSKQDAMRILGCQTLTRFLYSQADGTYTPNIEKLVHKVCALACEKGDEHQRLCLRASSLQCLSAMIWFMAQFSHILVGFDEIVYGILDNYEPDTRTDGDAERKETHHNWVDEVIRCEGRSGAISSGDTSPSYMMMKPQPEKKDPSLLTRKEIETPRVWAQICIQRMVELAKESTTMRRVVDPIFTYFDSGRHWVPRQGLAVIVLSDMSYFVDSSGNKQLILAALIRHLDHKNVSHDPQLKSYVIQVATALARQIRLGTVLAEIGFVGDLCRHLRKSLQATVESVGEQEANTNILLQNSIGECLLEIAKGIGDVQPLCDLMAITLEKLASGVVAKATIEALMILAHTISVASVSSRTQQIFPEGLLIQLLKAMLHSDVEARVGAHQIFSALLIPSSNHNRHGVASLRSGFLHQPRRWHSSTASASITALLEKLCREKDGVRLEKQVNNVHDDLKERNMFEEDWKQRRVNKNSPIFYKISSIVDRTAVSTSLSEAEPHIMKLNEEQIAQLLSAFWMQASLSDNLPSNFEAIAHSFVLALIYSGLKNPNDNLVVRFFQLSLSLRNMSLDPNEGMLPPACQRSIFVLSTGMLMFAAKIYHVLGLSDLLKSLVLNDVDPYIGISDDHQVYVKPQTNIREYGSVSDNQLATSLLSELRNKIFESSNVMMDILVQNLCKITGLEADTLSKQLSVSFTPDDAFMFGPQSILEFDHNQMVSNSKKSLSFDGDFSTNSLVEDDAISEAMVVDLSRFIPKMPLPPPLPHVISIGQLLESALEVAGHVAGTSVTTSPLAYNTMASQCEALGTGTRKKLSNWLAHENHQSRAVDKSSPAFLADGHLALKKGNLFQRDPWLAMRLPPASPFDNFLKAARC